MRFKSGNKILEVVKTLNVQSPRNDGFVIGVIVCTIQEYNYLIGDCLEDVEPYEAGDYFLPIYLKSSSKTTPYNHNGLTLDIVKDKDAFECGYIYAKASIVEMVGSDADVVSMLKDEIKIFNQYLTGEVYSYTITENETCNLGHVHSKIFGCGGCYYGSDIKTNGILQNIEEQFWEEVVDET